MGDINRMEGLVARNEEEDPIKNAHDQYNVYVNDEYVGNKTLVTQNEHVDDIKNYLEKQGVTNISAELDGDHYKISIENGEQQRVEEILSTYLSIR
ncbi:hypothetical protein HNQ94_002971 [Salirhabdus euzebyi]|uniref:Uncharacterized protein n=1 Tax=Salirhabdus euzebyi TaxID=394506 RepID=A0A841Q7E8_9BACI|nr:hypothetical protein [Salirhabdus euzebyi]MBB6454489.1 hypothetical protein [Salirhabdus euzebyi]